ncbi:hypothetical protein GAY33_10640 [Azospirillum brasilense]|nr:hypothetical protein [Azospirillum argentinense]
MIGTSVLVAEAGAQHPAQAVTKLAILRSVAQTSDQIRKQGPVVWPNRSFETHKPSGFHPCAASPDACGVLGQKPIAHHAPILSGRGRRRPSSASSQGTHRTPAVIGADRVIRVMRKQSRGIGALIGETRTAYGHAASVFEHRRRRSACRMSTASRWPPPTPGGTRRDLSVVTGLKAFPETP